MITSDLVVGHPLVLAGILIFEKALTNLVLQRSEIFVREFLVLLLVFHLMVMLSLLLSWP
jgi:hypothetical protein